MRLLITGSRGFIGGSVGRFAARLGHEVLGLGRSSEPQSDWPGKYVQADISEADLSGIVADFAPDVLFHAAGTASVGGSLAAPLHDLRTAILTWANTLDGVRRSGLKPLIFFPSTAAVYGNPATFPIGEDEAIAPISPYGFHKAACELLAREYSQCFGLAVIVCRFFSLFGRFQRRLLVWELCNQLAGNAARVWLHGTGTESRDYLHIDDICEAVFQLINRRSSLHRRGQCLVVNVASGEETKVMDLADKLRDLIAPEKKIYCRGLERQGDPRRWCADISLLRSLVPSWQPKSLSLALAQTVADWQRENDPSADGI